jgi:hypothetical protein
MKISARGFGWSGGLVGRWGRPMRRAKVNLSTTKRYHRRFPENSRFQMTKWPGIAGKPARIAGSSLGVGTDKIWDSRLDERTDDGLDR